MASERAPDHAFFGVLALLFVASAALTTHWCVSMSAMGGMAMPGGWTMSTMWMRMSGQTWFSAAAIFLGIWVVMMVAMMLPSLFPTLLRYQRQVRETDVPHAELRTMLAGTSYFLVWAVLGLAAYAVGAVITTAEMRLFALARLVPIATGMVLLLAGCFQLTRWKASLLTRCRDDQACSLHVGVGAGSACRQGIRWGIDCSLCCAGFMVILLVTGVMNLASMTMLAAAIAVERIVPWPERVAQIAGILIIGIGTRMIVRTLAG
jgi:predicted metal-binding membrane protein